MLLTRSPNSERFLRINLTKTQRIVTGKIFVTPWKNTKENLSKWKPIRALEGMI